MSLEPENVISSMHKLEIIQVMAHTMHNVLMCLSSEN